MQFNLEKTDPESQARAGTITLDHGPVETPIFMPVGTVGTVKGVHQRELARYNFRKYLSFILAATDYCS